MSERFGEARNVKNMEGEGEKILPKRLRLGLGLLTEGTAGLKGAWAAGRREIKYKLLI